MTDIDLFDQWWSSWPSPKTDKSFRDYTRKKNKKGCRKKWDDENLGEVGLAIIHDTESRKKYDKGWLKNGGKYLCGPQVYLNQAQWEDGEFADTRDDVKAVRKEIEEQIDRGPRMSRFARGANFIMLDVLYGKARGFRPVSEDILNTMLNQKRRMVRDFEMMDADGAPPTDKEFITSMTDGLRRCLKGDTDVTVHSD